MDRVDGNGRIMNVKHSPVLDWTISETVYSTVVLVVWFGSKYARIFQ